MIAIRGNTCTDCKLKMDFHFSFNVKADSLRNLKTFDEFDDNTFTQSTPR